MKPIHSLIDKACGFDREAFERKQMEFEDGVERMKAELFDFIAHGDENHRAWLRDAIDAYFGGKQRPPPR